MSTFINLSTTVLTTAICLAALGFATTHTHAQSSREAQPTTSTTKPSTSKPAVIEGEQSKDRSAIPTFYHNTQKLGIYYEHEATGAAKIYNYQLWFTNDGGKTWQPAPGRHKGVSPISFNAPADGRYSFYVQALDHAGHDSSPPQHQRTIEAIHVVDTQPPLIDIRSPKPKDQVNGGMAIQLDWNITDSNLVPLPTTLQWRRHGAEAWISIRDQAQAGKGRQSWWVPMVSGELEVQFIARDLAGNESRWITPAPIRVLPYNGFRGSEAMAAESFTNMRRFPVHYQVLNFMSPIEVSSVEIWHRHEFGEWLRETDPDRTSPYKFSSKADGNYWFYLRIVGINGEGDRPAPGADTVADLRVVVDTLPPIGQVLVGDNSDRLAHRGGQPLTIQWIVDEINLAYSGVQLEISNDNGENWIMLKDRLPSIGGVGRYTWAVPFFDSDSLRARILTRDLAGNRTTITSPTIVQLINPNKDPIKTAEEHYRQGVRIATLHDPGVSAHRRSLERSLELFNTALLYNPEHAEAWHDRGETLTFLQKLESALESYVKALHFQPGNLRFSFKVVNAHLRLYDSNQSRNVDHLVQARASFDSISSEAIYNATNYRKLRSEFRRLKREIKERYALEDFEQSALPSRN